MDRGAWRVTVYGVAKSQTQLSMQAGKKKKVCLAKLVSWWVRKSRELP